MAKIKDKTIVLKLYLETGNASEVARILDVSRERIRQILVNNFDIDPKEIKKEYKLSKLNQIPILKSKGYTEEQVMKTLNLGSQIVHPYFVRERKIHDLVGKTFGKRTVLSPLGCKTKEGNFDINCTDNARYYWQCKCICGKVEPVNGKNLTNPDIANSCINCAKKGRPRTITQEDINKFIELVDKLGTIHAAGLELGWSNTLIYKVAKEHKLSSKLNYQSNRIEYYRHRKNNSVD